MLSIRKSTLLSIGEMMNGIAASPIRVGANLLIAANWSGFGSSTFLPNGFFLGAVFLDSSSSASPLMSLLEALTNKPIMFPGIMTEAKHCQIRQSSPVVKTAAVKAPPSLPYWSAALLKASATQ